MNKKILNNDIKSFIDEFYKIQNSFVIFKKKERNKIWKELKNNSISKELLEKINKLCPAFTCEINKQKEKNKHIQSAVFSECVYSQTLANILKLSCFVDCHKSKESFSYILNNIDIENFIPRYVYHNLEKSLFLIQGGGPNSTDAILFNKSKSSYLLIEFKEPYSKISEIDLPKYEDDGLLNFDDSFLTKNHNFKKMLEEKQGLNLFEFIGKNINDFSEESVSFAVLNNYNNGSKTADIICTEDLNGFLTLFPTNDINEWANLEGELRPAGRNKHKIWTYKAFINFLKNLDAEIKDNNVRILKTKLSKRKERGGTSVSAYKINSLFFIRVSSCFIHDDYVSFSIDKVKQLNPTISVKMNFKSLSYEYTKDFYQKLKK
ncbi:hypothetical protein [Mycoplasmopsis arginini]|uniref:hypothetical protein n=1 Tax=Mycoplasmopsis arginini TaxID=2094 RepID=UPI0002D184FE|nr:hypothetical protein [Mycoplasmopsis arginini]ENY69655.1 Hypothetical protein MARG_3450 [Mycoplasmopsis arginini 7264]